MDFRYPDGRKRASSEHDSGHAENRDPRKKAMDLLLYRDRTEKELRDRLLEAGFDEKAAEEGISYVASFGYLNDTRYAENYVFGMQGRKSRRRIRRELEEKGIAEETVENALSRIPENETEQIYALLCKRAGAPHSLEEKELRKLFGYLARRGFRTGDIWSAVRQYQEKQDFPA